MGNTVEKSNANFCNFSSSQSDAYLLGLWCADGYHRSSSIGLCNINIKLISSFVDFFRKFFTSDRLKLKVYVSEASGRDYQDFGIADVKLFNSEKAKSIAYHIYVNSRPLLREFKKAKILDKYFKSKSIGWAYIAGRFDGDGTSGKDLKRDIRISYTTKQEAEYDKELLFRLGVCTKIYWYRTSSTHVIYVPRGEAKDFVKNCLSHSAKLQKLAFDFRRDLTSSFEKGLD